MTHWRHETLRPPVVVRPMVHNLVSPAPPCYLAFCFPLTRSRVVHYIILITMAGLEGCFLCFGNPLLDVSAVVDQAFLDKYEVG